MVDERESSESLSVSNATGDSEEKTPKSFQAMPSITVPSRSLRNRQDKQTKLLYDQKYHPMDESIRPSQAAKRRLVHGAIMSSAEDVYADDDVESLANRKNEKIVQSGRKRKYKKRSGSQSPMTEPTRRSTRKTLNTSACYNMEIHPQDAHLESLSSSDDSYAEAHSIATGGNDPHRLPESHTSLPNSPTDTTRHARMTSTPVSDLTPNAINLDEPLLSLTDHDVGDNPLQNEPDICLQTSSPLSSTTPTPPKLPRQEYLNPRMPASGKHYHGRDEDPYPLVPGLPFEIYTERLKDQRSTKANEILPLEFEHDDKENDPDHREVAQPLSAVDGIHVMSDSQYQQRSENAPVSRDFSLVQNAFYNDFGQNISPYGLGGNDGACDEATANQWMYDLIENWWDFAQEMSKSTKI